MPVGLNSIDLNLLRVLDAVLTERSVTRAAQRLGITQPAVSAALARLRRHFSDELLSRSGNRYELTPLAQQLKADTATALASAKRVFDVGVRGDSQVPEREFTLMLSDYAAVVLGEQISRAFAAQAPKASLRLEMPTPYLVDQVAETLRVMDGFVLPHGIIHDVPHVDLFSDEWVGLAAADNPIMDGPISLEQLAHAPWVLTYDTRTAFTPAQQHLRMLGVEPMAAVVVESFLALPFFVAGTDRVAMVQRRLAARIAGLVDVRIFELPFRAVPLVESLWWHPSYHRDPAHAWLRRMLRAVGRDITAESAPGPGTPAQAAVSSPVSDASSGRPAGED